MYDELETTLTKLEQEVMDELENPYRPFSVIFPYEVRFTIPGDGHNTEVTIRTQSEEVRFGRNENDVLLQKEVDNHYGKYTYSHHILNWLSLRLSEIDPRECDLEYTGIPKVSAIDDSQVKEFVEDYLKDE